MDEIHPPSRPTKVIGGDPAGDRFLTCFNDVFVVFQRQMPHEIP